jgi:hypothetical protein
VRNKMMGGDERCVRSGDEHDGRPCEKSPSVIYVWSALIGWPGFCVSVSILG